MIGPSLLIPYICLIILAKSSSSCVTNLHPSFISRDRFVHSLCSFQTKTPSLLWPTQDLPTNLMDFLPLIILAPYASSYSSLWTLTGILWTCIWNTLIVLITDLANFSLPALDKHFVFQPSSLPLTFFISRFLDLLQDQHVVSDGPCTTQVPPSFLLKILSSSGSFSDQKDWERKI